MREAVLPPPPTGLTRPRVPHTIQSDRFCTDCGCNLHGESILRDERLNTLLVLCPDCNRPAIVQARRMVEFWSDHLLALSLVMWMMLVLAIAVGVVAMTAAASFGFGLMITQGRTGLLLNWLPIAGITFVLGTVVSAMLPGLRLRGRFIWASALGVVAIICLSRWLASDQEFLRGVGLNVVILSVIGLQLSHYAGLLVGPTLWRWIATYALPPARLPWIAWLWTDGRVR